MQGSSDSGIFSENILLDIATCKYGMDILLFQDGHLYIIFPCHNFWDIEKYLTWYLKPPFILIRSSTSSSIEIFPPIVYSMLQIALYKYFTSVISIKYLNAKWNQHKAIKFSLVVLTFQRNIWCFLCWEFEVLSNTSGIHKYLQYW